MYVGGHLVQALPFVYAFLFGKLIIIIIIKDSALTTDDGKLFHIVIVNGKNENL